MRLWHGIRVPIDANGKNMSDTLSSQAFGASDHQRRIQTLDVVVIERVGSEPVFARHQGNLRLARERLHRFAGSIAPCTSRSFEKTFRQFMLRFSGYTRDPIFQLKMLLPNRAKIGDINVRRRKAIIVRQPLERRMTRCRQGSLYIFSRSFYSKQGPHGPHCQAIQITGWSHQQ